jgi:hypothetical protein
MIDEELRDKLWEAYHRPGDMPLKYRKYAAGRLAYSDRVHLLYYTIETSGFRTDGSLRTFMAWRSLCGRVVITEPDMTPPLRPLVEVNPDEWCGLCKQYGIPDHGGIPEQEGGAAMAHVDDNQLDIEFELHSITKSTYRYEELVEVGREPVMKTIYLKKWIFPAPKPPEKVRLSVNII